MYYIYHIPGIKVGCTKDIRKRMNEQRSSKTYELLAVTEDIEEASQLEIKYQQQFNYRRDTEPYSSVINKGFKPGWKPTAKHKEKISEKTKGTTSSRYATGDRYREISTGFEGYSLDHKKHFNILHDVISYSVKKGQPYEKGDREGMQWVKL
jgi:hypothetical protein